VEHEHTEHVAAAPERVFAALADPGNLPSYVPQVTAAEAGPDGRVHVRARYDGHVQEGDAWFRTDEANRRVEWGSDGGYRGWMQVDPDGDGSRLTLFLATHHGDASDHEVMGTLDGIRRLVEAKV
jgi:uncharacterized protein YndB with AHSA1/START domain